jgi:hypothetical protein
LSAGSLLSVAQTEKAACENIMQDANKEVIIILTLFFITFPPQIYLVADISHTISYADIGLTSSYIRSNIIIH